MPEREGGTNKDQGFGELVKGFGDLISILTDALEAGASSTPTSGVTPAPLRDVLVDVFNEDTEIVLVVELPGVAANEIRIELQDDILALTTTGERTFSTEVLLPAPVRATTWRQQFRNGILEVRLRKV